MNFVFIGLSRRWFIEIAVKHFKERCIANNRKHNQGHGKLEK